MVHLANNAPTIKIRRKPLLHFLSIIQISHTKILSTVSFNCQLSWRHSSFYPGAVFLIQWGHFLIRVFLFLLYISPCPWMKDMKGRLRGNMIWLIAILGAVFISIIFNKFRSYTQLYYVVCRSLLYMYIKLVKIYEKKKSGKSRERKKGDKERDKKERNKIK